MPLLRSLPENASLADLRSLSADLTDKLRPYAEHLMRGPSPVAADAEAVFQAGWSDEALFHAVAVCAYFNQMNRLVEGTGIVGTHEEYRQASDRLAHAGYRSGGGPRPRIDRGEMGRASAARPPRPPQCMT